MRHGGVRSRGDRTTGPSLLLVVRVLVLRNAGARVIPVGIPVVVSKLLPFLLPFVLALGRWEVRGLSAVALRLSPK